MWLILLWYWTCIEMTCIVDVSKKLDAIYAEGQANLAAEQADKSKKEKEKFAQSRSKSQEVCYDTND